MAWTVRRRICTSPATPRDGVTVTVPIFALNQVSEERAEWLVPGMLAQKVTALLKSLHQKPRARLTPLPDCVAEFIELQPFCHGGLVDTLAQGASRTAARSPCSATTSSWSCWRRTC